MCTFYTDHPVHILIYIPTLFFSNLNTTKNLNNLWTYLRKNTWFCTYTFYYFTIYYNIVDCLMKKTDLQSEFFNIVL